MSRGDTRSTEEIPQLPQMLSLKIEDACACTGFSESRMREFIRTKRVHSFRLGKRRFVEAHSLRALIAALAAEAEAPRPQPRRGKRGRWLGSAEQPPAKARVTTMVQR